eukprot:TRINITY_DN14064_c0_g1_i1.p1 TRINITY_DN14064_c0_g1~~TRINITY_DN14064_c0_g1_i1.p1  ORF type:complete len:976 (+),score=212.24 TRINITY_DN14064_c0_g1_i1:59-2986(+)
MRREDPNHMQSTSATHITASGLNPNRGMHQTVPVIMHSIPGNSIRNDISMAPIPAEQSKERITEKFENALDFLDQVKLQFQSQPEIYNRFLDVMKEFKDGRIDTEGVIARVAEIFKGHNSLVEGFNTFLPLGQKIEAPDPVAMKQPEFDQARVYVTRIKERFLDEPEVYKEFLGILHAFHREQRTIKDVYGQVARLFRNEPDLLEEFTHFLPDPVRPGNKASRKKAKKKSKSKKRAPPQNEQTLQELNFFYKVKKKMRNPRLYAEFLKCLRLFSKKIITRLELVILVTDILAPYPEMFERFKILIGFSEEDEIEMQASESDSSSEEEEQGRWSDLDFSTLQCYGPSYRIIPKRYRQKSTVRLDPDLKACMNNRFVSVPTGSEDFFASTRKNQYEELLFKCEDERYELDLVIELNASAIKALQPYLKKLKGEENIPDSELNLKNTLDVLHIRSIERIYGAKGAEVVEGLFSNPIESLPVILKRLQQKDYEWRKARQEWNKIWREVNAKNYHKSLDYQSFYFKQTEKKNLNPKVLLGEIKQKYREKAKQKSGTTSPAGDPETEAGDSDRKKTGRKTEQETFYHMKYTLDDASTLQDMINLVVNASEKVMSKSDREKLDAFLQVFVAEVLHMENHKVTSNDEAATTTASMDVDKDEDDNASSMVIADEDEEEGNEESEVRPASNTTTTVRVFFGNVLFYTFFRLYETLYSRLAQAKRMVTTGEQERWAASVLTPPNKLTAEDEAKRDKYQYLITSIYALLDNSLDQSKFEDDCRELFGISSYVLFTVNKLILSICKQLQVIISDDECIKLVALYKYERARAVGEENAYRSNVIGILGDEKCFRFEFNQRSGHFTIQLLDSSHKLHFVDLSFHKEEWSKYVNEYMQSDGTNIDVQKHKVFLLRNRKSRSAKSLENVAIKNGLECKICLSTYKMFYVEETEDHLYRKGTAGRTKPQIAAKRAKKFEKWRAAIIPENVPLV